MSTYGYSRISRRAGRAGDSFQSEKQQRDEISRWAALTGREIAGWYHDEDQSGAGLDRPELNALLARMVAGDTLVVAKLDRFARSLVDALKALKALDKRGVEFVSATDPFDTTTPTGELALQMMFVLAEFELKRITETWRLSATNAVGRGVHIARSEIYGYTRTPGGQLDVAPAQADAVREAYRRRAGGDSLGSIAAWLNAEAPGRTDGHAWTENSTGRMLRKGDVYLGVASWGARVRHEEAHDPIIGLALSAAAGQRRGTAKPSNGGRPLGGVVRCAGCGYVMSAAAPAGRPAVYRCRGKRDSGRCPAPAAIEAGAVEVYVWGQVNLLLNWDWTSFGDAVPLDTIVATASSAEREAAQRELDRAEHELDEFMGNVEYRRELGDLFLRALQPLRERLDAARRALEELPAGAEGWEALAGMVWDEMDRDIALREVLASAADAVVVRAARQVRVAEPAADRCAIVWDAGHAWPAGGRRGLMAPYDLALAGPPSPGALGRLLAALARAEAAREVPIFAPTGRYEERWASDGRGGWMQEEVEEEVQVGTEAPAAQRGLTLRPGKLT